MQQTLSVTGRAQEPLVSCLLLTADRRDFVPGAIQRFLDQDYPHRELIILDDGQSPAGDLVPSDPRIRYIRLHDRLNIGAKRNRGCHEARGEFIAHWDDDDWMAPWRLSYQMTEVLKFGADICGLRQLYFWGPTPQQAWEYVYEAESQPWVAGGTMLYRRSLWAQRPFDEINIGEDNAFVWNETAKSVLPLVDRRFYVASIHPGNTSPKIITPERWRSVPFDEVQQVMGDDLSQFGTLLFGEPPPLEPAEVELSPATSQAPLGFFTPALRSHLNLPEFQAFNHGKELPWMRRWEIPFALFQSRLSNTMAVLDCSINSAGLGQWIGELYPHVLYRQANPLANETYLLPPSAPDESFDRIFCLNSLEHFPKPQREELIAALASKLKPGGWLVVTADFYFESSWSKKEWLDTGLIRRDHQEVPNGFNRVTPVDLAELCARHNLHPLASVPAEPREGDRELYLNPAPMSHAAIGAVFVKSSAPPIDPQQLLPAGRSVLLALLTWNTATASIESLQAHLREARMLRRLGHDPRICVVDNGSTDGTAAELHKLDGTLDIPHRFIFNPTNIGNSHARNQLIEHMLETGADYIVFVDGDIELVPFTTFVMLRHMENCGSRLGCFGAYSFSCTTNRAQATPALFSLANCRLHSSDTLAWTQYGIFRRQIFADGVAFDVSGPFGEPGHGLEDVDLAFQIQQRGYLNQYFSGISYLHRNMSSSVGILSQQGMEPTERYYRRKEYVIAKWQDVPAISQGPLNWVRHARAPWSEVRAGKLSTVRLSSNAPEIPVPGEVMEWVDQSVSDMLDRTELIALAAVLASFNWKLSSLIVEIGAYLGTTTVFMAKVLELLDARANILSIDPFERCKPDNLNPQGRYQDYINNTQAAGVEHTCFALAGFSADVASAVPNEIGVLVIDGSHHYDAVKADLALYLPKLIPGGYAFLDDYGPAYPDVVRAIDEYLPSHPEFEVLVKSYYVILRRRT